MVNLYYSNSNNEFKIVYEQSPLFRLQQHFHKCVLTQNNVVHEIVQHPKNIKITSLCKYEPTIQETRKTEAIKKSLQFLTNKPCNTKRISIDDIVDKISSQNSNYFEEDYNSEIGSDNLLLKFNIIIDNKNSLKITRNKKYDFIYHKSMKDYINELIIPFINIREFIQTNPNQIFEYFKLGDILSTNQQNTLSYSHFNKFITFVKSFDLPYVLDFINNGRMQDYELQRSNIANLLSNLSRQQINILLNGVRFTDYGISFGHFQIYSSHPMDNECFVSHLAKHNLFDKLTFQLNKIKLLSL